MHIPDSMLQGAVCPITAGLGLLGVAAAAVVAAKSEDKPKAARFAGVTTLIFAAQMVNFPITGGTSGHLLGAVLAAALLGPSFAVLAMGLVLAIQALVFADGGLMAYGANLLNMGLLAVAVGAPLHTLLRRRSLSVHQWALLIAGGGWLAVMLAALATSVELAAGGEATFATVAGAMLSNHAWIGLGEGLLTAVLYLALAPHAGKARDGRLLPLAAAALLLSPWASSLPDGLEAAATHLGLLSEGSTLFAPLADYSLPALGQPQLGTLLAGACGALLTFGLARLLAASLRDRTAASTS